MQNILYGDGHVIWKNRSQFLAVAAEAMRRILVDSARRKRSVKHGGDRERIDLEQEPLVAPSRAENLIALDDGSKLSGLQRIVENDANGDAGEAVEGGNGGAEGDPA